jgi:hypothetical protein
MTHTPRSVAEGFESRRSVFYSRALRTLRLILLTVSVAGTALMGSATAYAKDAAGRAVSKQYFFLVFSNPVEGQEAEYNRWYNNDHGPDVLAIPGFVSGRRFVLADLQLRAVPRKMPRYLILYRIVTADPAGVRAEIERRAKTGLTRMSPTITDVKMYTYLAFRPPHTGATHVADDSLDMPAYEQVVFGDAVTGMDNAFNHWYDTVHEPELLSVPGFARAQRGIISPFQFAPTDERERQSKYLALFEIRSRNLAQTFQGIGHMSEPIPAFDRSRTFGYTYMAIGPVLYSEEIRAARLKSAHP